MRWSSEDNLFSEKNVLWREPIISKLHEMRGRQREDEADGTQEMISLVVYMMLIGADYQRCLCEEKAEIMDDRQIKEWGDMEAQVADGKYFLLIDIKRFQKHLNDDWCSSKMAKNMSLDVNGVDWNVIRAKRSSDEGWREMKDRMPNDRKVNMTMKNRR